MWSWFVCGSRNRVCEFILCSGLAWILFVFQVWPTHLQAAVRVRYRHSVERGKEVPLVRLQLRNSNSLHKDLNVSGWTRRRADKVCLEGQLHLIPLYHPATESCQWLWSASGCGSMPGSPTGQQEVFSTAQMTQIAQIVSLNQAMGEFNMRLNGLQQQVVHQQNVFAQAQVQQAASQPAQVPVAKTSPSISSGLSSFGDRPPTSPQPNFPRNTVEQPPGLQQSPQRLISEVRQGQGTAQNTQGEASSQDDRDVFTKSEKWLPPLPKCEHGTWKTREQEILGFAGYVQSLRSWVALASDTFGWELESALSWPHELHMTNLKPAQQLRSARLLAILTQAFAESIHELIWSYRPIQKELVWMVLFRQCEERLVLRRCVCLQRSSVWDQERKLHFSGLSSCPRRLRHRVALHRSVI